MEPLYHRNALMFWTEEEIQLRKMLENYFVLNLTRTLKEQNRAFEFAQVEAPLLSPREFISPNYSDEDMYATVDNLVLRPETTLGSYVAARDLLNPYRSRKYKLPLVVWQHQKSFRREQDQPIKNMRLKEFYQLEFQILFSVDTKNDYAPHVIAATRKMISDMISPCRVEPSDRLPAYAEWTQDIICESTNMEVCSISRRKDFEMAANIEVAIGTDRCIYNMQQR